MEPVIVSKEALDKLKSDLEILKSKRREMSERIERAKEMGDLSENFEYHEAKDAQGMNEAKIRDLETKIKSAIVQDSTNNTGNVVLGSVVDVEFNAVKKQFTIVSFNEADPGSGKISNESPIGKALLGHNEGDSVQVETPTGTTEFKIIKIS